MSETSPLPWFVHDFADPRVSKRPGPEDVTISCDHPATITVASMGRGMTATLDEARANAAFIARAVNAHAEMAEALTQAEGLLIAQKLYAGASPRGNLVLAKIRSALAKATTQEG